MPSATPPRKQGTAAPVQARTATRSPTFRILLGLTVIAALVGIWAGVTLLVQQQEELTIQARPADKGLTGWLAPDFTLPTADGGTVQLNDLRGQVVLLNFWATWCPPCKAEMPDLNALHVEHQAAHGFTVVGVNMQETAEQVNAFAQPRQLAFPLALDTTGQISSGLFAVRGLPVTYIIDRDGFVRDMWQGQISRAAMLARLEEVW